MDWNKYNKIKEDLKESGKWVQEIDTLFGNSAFKYIQIQHPHYKFVLGLYITLPYNFTI